MSRKKTLVEWQSESDSIHNKEFTILENPDSGSQIVKVFHKKCGNVLSTNLNNHIRRYCKYCNGKNKKTKENWQILSDQIHDSKFEILDCPKNGKSKVRIFHKDCGNIFFQTMNNHINHRNGCKKCAKNSFKNNEFWQKKCQEIWNGDYQILEEVKNCNKKVKILHTICNRYHLKNMSSFIHNKRGCPYCSKQDTKYAEDYISKYLDSRNIKYEREKTFEGLINPKTGRKLRFDFYLSETEQVIEVHGVQHYKPIEFWGGEEYFMEQLFRDKIKEDFLISNKIKYHIINNKQLTKIKEIL